jgi:NitT/TauT family transport system substrate-binding protein
LREVLVYPGHFVVPRSTPGVAGVVHGARNVLAGESWRRGQVIWPGTLYWKVGGRMRARGDLIIESGMAENSTCEITPAPTECLVPKRSDGEREMAQQLNPARRRVVASSFGAAGLMASSSLLSIVARAAGKTKINLQLGWLIGGNQLGEIVAKRLGYFDKEDIDFQIQPGGPSIDGVAVVASGRFELGQVSSSPSLMLAVSQGLPVKCFAVGIQKHPYCFFSLKKSPIHSANDMVGKKIGIQSTGIILLRALLAKNKIPEKDVTIVPIGADMTPLMTGQVDAVTGWTTNTTALKVLGPDRVDLALWDTGVKLYALPYYATTQTLQSHGDVLAGFIRAAAKGWGWADKNRDHAVDILVKEYPNLNRADERVAADVMLAYSFGDVARAQGWGTMDPANWQEQIALYSELGQFTARTPKVDDVITLDILKATQAARRMA